MKTKQEEMEFVRPHMHKETEKESVRFVWATF